VFSTYNTNEERERGHSIRNTKEEQTRKTKTQKERGTSSQAASGKHRAANEGGGGNGGETQVFPPGQEVPECIMQIIAMAPSEDGVEGEPPFIRAGQRAR
jgi:hypothetical protein